MKSQIITFLMVWKKLKRDDYVYMSILGLFFIIVLSAFILVLRFLSLQMTTVLSYEKVSTPLTLNLIDYTMVARRLNIPLGIDAGQTSTTEIKIPTSTSTQETTIDKQSLIIKILNSTSKKGVASALSKTITNAGFLVVTTGNSDTPHATTTLIIGRSNSPFIPLLLHTIQADYPNTIATTTGASAAYDAIIIIGEN